jgi:hypothetical protein
MFSHAKPVGNLQHLRKHALVGAKAKRDPGPRRRYPAPLHQVRVLHDLPLSGFELSDAMAEMRLLDIGREKLCYFLASLS